MYRACPFERRVIQWANKRTRATGKLRSIGFPGQPGADGITYLNRIYIFDLLLLLPSSIVFVSRLIRPFPESLPFP